MSGSGVCIRKIVPSVLQFLCRLCSDLHRLLVFKKLTVVFQNNYSNWVITDEETTGEAF